ncbi:hypothetical protein [Methylobacterium sp. R2-1]|nr:hypothetical protein [Methylobacterium sp. R2-1]
MQHSFLLTAGCELYVLFYALWGCRAKVPAADTAVPPAVRPAVS